MVRAGVDTLFIQRRLMTSSWPVPVRELKDLRVARGTRTRPVAASVGLVLGIPVGAVVGTITCYMGGCTQQNWGWRSLIGAIGGAALGFKVGFGPHDRWVPVILPSLGVR